MIKSVEIVNEKNEHTTMVLRDPRPSGLLITDITGLDAPKGTIKMIERTQLNGSVYNGSKANSRNIVLSVKYLGSNQNVDSIEGVRHDVYRMFPIGENVQVIVHTDMRDVFFNGYVESNEVNIFSQNEGSQISILCEDAYGHGKENQIDTFTGVNSRFEFPFSNESLTQPTIEFGEVFLVQYKRTFYEGEVRTGFTLKIDFTESVSGITVTNLTTKQKMVIQENFVEGDTLEVCTIQGQKHATKNGSNIIGSFYTTASNDWVELVSGDNYLEITDGSGQQSLTTTIAEIEAPILYMGI